MGHVPSLCFQGEPKDTETVLRGSSSRGVSMKGCISPTSQMTYVRATVCFNRGYCEINLPGIVYIHTQNVLDLVFQDHHSIHPLSCRPNPSSTQGPLRHTGIYPTVSRGVVHSIGRRIIALGETLLFPFPPCHLLQPQRDGEEGPTYWTWCF